MKIHLHKLFAVLLCLSGTILPGAEDAKPVLAGFSDRKSLHFEENSVSVSPDGRSLFVTGKKANWNRFMRTRPGVLKPDTDYTVTFRFRANGPVDLIPHLHFLIRPYGAENADFDLMHAFNYTPGAEYRDVVIRFRTNGRADYAFQIHSRGRIKAEISDFTLRQGARNGIVAVPNRTEPYPGTAALLPTGAEEFEVERPRNPGGTTANAADFGVSEKNADNIEALNRAIAHCARNGIARLELNPGVYRMTAETPLRFRDLKDFEFDGGGSTLIFHRTIPGVNNCEVDNCERTILRNFNMDWDWATDPLASLVRIAAVGKDHIDAELYEYEHFPKRDVSIAHMTSYDTAVGAVGREDGVSRPFKMARNRTAPKVAWLSDNTLRIFSAPGKIAPGDTFRMQHYYYNDNDGFHLNGNVHFTMEDVNIYSCAGHAIKVNGHQQYWQLLRVTVSPPKGVPRRPISSTADHCHIARSNGFLKIEDCEFSHGADDCLNLHDVSAFVVRSGPRSVRSLRRRPDGLPEVGARVELRNADYSPAVTRARVEKISEIDRKNGVYELSFDCDIPEPPPGEFGFVLYDHSYGSRNIIIRNSQFHRNRARGLLLLGRDITVENNHFFHNEMGAIRIETGYTFDRWSEGYGASNIVVRNNVFDTVNPSDTKDDDLARDIYIGSYMQKDPTTLRTDYPILRDILFENNTFKETFGLVAFISSAESVIFRNNTFINTVARKKPLPYRAGFFITHAGDIRIVNNRFVKSPYAAPAVRVDSRTTRDITVQGNCIVEN